MNQSGSQYHPRFLVECWQIQTVFAVCRDMNAWTSQEVFAGPYLQDPVERKKFSSAFIDMTVVRDLQP